MVCGATGLIMLVIESKVYVFSLGDCRGYLFRNEVLFQLNLPHLPVQLIVFRVEETKGLEYRMQEDSYNTIDSWVNARSPAALGSSSIK